MLRIKEFSLLSSLLERKRSFTGRVAVSLTKRYDGFERVLVGRVLRIASRKHHFGSKGKRVLDLIFRWFVIFGLTERHFRGRFLILSRLLKQIQNEWVIHVLATTEFLWKG